MLDTVQGNKPTLMKQLFLVSVLTHAVIAATHAASWLEVGHSTLHSLGRENEVISFGRT